MADNRLRFFLTGDSKQFNRALTSAEQKLKAFGSKLQSTGRSLTMMTAPLAAAGGAAIKMAANFDKSMTKIKTLVGLSGDAVDSFRDDVMRMAKETGSNADEAANALFFITSAGIELEDAMVVLEKSLKASAIGLGDVATVADSATSAMNAYGSSTLSAEMATDVLTNTVRLGKLSSEELAGSIGQVIPIASNLGVQFHEVGATLAAMSRTGTNAATASMQLKNILISILKPSTEGAETLEAMGLSSQKLRQQIQDEGLLSVLTTLKNRFEENEDAQAKVFGSSRALMGVMDLLGKGFSDTEKIFASMANSAGVTAEAYEELQNSAEFKLRKAMVEVKETFRETGAVLLEALLPAIKTVTGIIKTLLERFNNLSDGTQKFIGVATMIGTILGPVLIALGSLISAIGSIIGLVTSATGGIKLLNIAMKANPAVRFATIILGAAAALRSLGQARKEAQMEKLNEELNALSLEDAESRLAKLTQTFDANNEIIEENNKKGIANKKLILEDAEGNKIATRELVSKNKALGQEIELLKELIEQRKALAAPAPTTTGGDTGGTGTGDTGGGDGGVKRVQAVSVSALTASNALVTLGNTGDLVGTTLNTAIGSSDEKIKQFSQSAINATMLMQSAFSALGQSIAASFDTGSAGLDAFLGTLISGAVKYIGVALAKSTAGAIESGVESSKAAGPFAAFVLPALIAGAVATVSGAFKKVPKFAKGGIVSTPTMGLFGEYPGAKSNPEVVAPLDKLTGMLGNQGGGQVQVGGEFKIKGQDLVVALQRANRNRDRIK
jgi:TP901 family phage tail tape measure protein